MVIMLSYLMQLHIGLFTFAILPIHTLESLVWGFLKQRSKVQHAGQIYMYIKSAGESVYFPTTDVHTAAMFGLADVGAKLLANGHSPDIVSETWPVTLLALAAWMGEAAMVELLADRDDVEKNSSNAAPQTPLSLAAEEGREAVVKLLVGRADVEVNAGNFRGQSPFSLAAARGHEAVVHLMFQHENVQADS